MVAYAKARGQFPNVTVAENHQLFNQTWIALANSLWFHRDLIVVWIGLPRPPDRGYRTILGGRPANFVLTSQAGPEAPTFDPVWIDAAARSLGYRLVKTFRMPDGRLVWDWWRRSPADDV